MITKVITLLGDIITIEKVDDNIVDDLKLQVKQLESLLTQSRLKSNEKEGELIRLQEALRECNKCNRSLQREVQAKSVLINKLDALHSDLVNAIESTLQVYR